MGRRGAALMAALIAPSAYAQDLRAHFVVLGHGALIAEAAFHDQFQPTVCVAAYVPEVGLNLIGAAAVNRHQAPGIAALRRDACGYWQTKRWRPNLRGMCPQFMATVRA
jgi:hypothetical protein